MIQLGDSYFWLDPGPTGWVLIEVQDRGRKRSSVRHGTYTSPAHVLQQRRVKLPKGAREWLRDMVDVTRAADDALAELKVLESPSEPAGPPPEPRQDVASPDEPDDE